MRAFASGLGARSDSTPTRLLRLPPRALQLFAAYRAHPEWSEDVLMECSAGGKTAIAFVGWARELERVYQEQSRLEDFLRWATSITKYTTCKVSNIVTTCIARRTETLKMIVSTVYLSFDEKAHSLNCGIRRLILRLKHEPAVLTCL